MSTLLKAIVREKIGTKNKIFVLCSSSNNLKQFVQLFSASAHRPKGLMLGVYEPAEEGGQFLLTPTGQKVNERFSGKLQSVLKNATRKLKCGSSRVLFGIDDGQYTSIAVANLGKQDVDFDEEEQIYQGKENIRAAVASAVLLLRDAGETAVDVDTCGDAQAAAEASLLALHSFDELRQEKDRKPAVDVNLLMTGKEKGSPENNWTRGEILAKAQNFARYLMESPANKMTPTIFSEAIEATKDRKKWRTMIANAVKQGT
ncbi:LOW QUALITY PROTEIN: leucine aminopeptidase-like protein [Plakobranchus ocellatus]|uniref:Leucine aminopeptidase-like protein n=1 Tax=Plakobranchus ocellatus TaxID=259542 RepID=A0AAV4D163_9GAST|nr:LOW QUALITY PROTEIN: leucine aminopeptidase-like protein [Plakobranchus ocellatus]